MTISLYNPTFDGREDLHWPHIQLWLKKKEIQVAESEKGNKPREMEIGVFMIYFVINLLNCVVTAAVFYFNCWGVGIQKRETTLEVENVKLSLPKK